MAHVCVIDNCDIRAKISHLPPHTRCAKTVEWSAPNETYPDGLSVEYQVDWGNLECVVVNSNGVTVYQHFNDQRNPAIDCKTLDEAVELLEKHLIV